MHLGALGNLGAWKSGDMQLEVRSFPVSRAPAAPSHRRAPGRPEWVPRGRPPGGPDSPRSGPPRGTRGAAMAPLMARPPRGAPGHSGGRRVGAASARGPGAPLIEQLRDHLMAPSRSYAEVISGGVAGARTRGRTSRWARRRGRRSVGGGADPPW